jgi:hypothetical protein
MAGKRAEGQINEGDRRKRLTTGGLATGGSNV